MRIKTLYNSIYSIKIENIKYVIDKKIFIFTFISVFIIHGQIIFNKLSWHDDVSTLYGWSGGLIHGRWTYYYLELLIKKLLGSASLNVYNGIIVALCISLIVNIIIDLYKIKGSLIRYILALLFVSVPYVCAHFGYMVSAPMNYFGYTLSVISAYITCKGISNNRYKIVNFLLAIFILTISIGEYQCNISAYLSISLLFLIYKVLNTEEQESPQWNVFIGNGIYMLIIAFISLLLYLLVLQIVLQATGIILTEYAGTNTYGITSLEGYIQRVKDAFHYFFFTNYKATIFPFNRTIYKKGVILLLILFTIMRIIPNLKKNKSKVIQIFICAILFPLAINFNYLMYGTSPVHILHQYHGVLIFVYGSIMMDDNYNSYNKNFKKIKYVTICVLFLLLTTIYIWKDNLCYTFAEIRQEQAISYYTELKTRIEMTSGYLKEMPVAFINADNKEGINFVVNIPEHNGFPIPYGLDGVDSYSWITHMYIWTGYKPEVIDPAPYETMKEVKAMTNYPSDGSIRIIDDVVVVKF